MKLAGPASAVSPFHRFFSLSRTSAPACADELLLSSVLPILTDEEGRLDLVLYRGSRDFSTLGVELLGNHASIDKVFNGLAFIWPSDHAGVAAKLKIHN